MVAKLLLVPGVKYRLALDIPYKWGSRDAVLVYLKDEGDNFVFTVGLQGMTYSVPKEYVESWEQVPYETVCRTIRPSRREKVKSA